jgi:two-component system, cell cycle response regulator
MKEEGSAADPLTGLHNRRYILQELERHIEIHKRYGHPFALLRVGFDNLKSINDTFGDAGGDSVLQHLLSLMEMNLRDVDIACRYGGDEFVVIMPETDKPAVQAVGRRMAQSVSSTRFNIGDSVATAEVSFGAASCPEDGAVAETLLQAAVREPGPGE